MDAVETAQWVSGIEKSHFSLAAAIKAILVFLAVFGCSTMWFAAVLDGAAALAGLLFAVRAYYSDQPHRHVKDLLKPYRSN